MKSVSKSSPNLEDPRFIAAIDDLSLWSAPFGLKLLDAVVMRLSLTVLDLGCGLGFPLLEIAQRLGETSRVWGLDPWHEALKRANDKAHAFSVTNVETIQGVGEAMPFADDRFDLIVSNNGINNVVSMETTMAECHRVAKDGCQLVVTMNLEETMIEFYSIFALVLIENGMDETIDAMQEHIHSKRKPLDEVQRIIQQSGFELNRVIHDAFRFRYANGTAMLDSGMIRFWFYPSWRSLLPPDRADELFDEIESRLNALSKAEGGLSLSIPFVTIDARSRK